MFDFLCPLVFLVSWWFKHSLKCKTPTASALHPNPWALRLRYSAEVHRSSGPYNDEYTGCTDICQGVSATNFGGSFRTTNTPSHSWGARYRAGTRGVFASSGVGTFACAASALGMSCCPAAPL